MRIKYVYVTENGKNLAEKLKLQIHGNVSCFKDFKDSLINGFDSDAYILIMASGIAVRTLAPYIRSKFTDPAVVVMDEKGKYAISLLSGHMGGANELAQEISSVSGAIAIITTATDINGKGSFDLIVKKVCGYVDNLRENTLRINKAILQEERVFIYIDKNFRDIFKSSAKDDACKYINLLNGFKIIESFHELNKQYRDAKAVENICGNVDKISSFFIVLSDRKLDLKKDMIHIIPRKNILAVGCRKNTDSEVFERTILDFVDTKGLDIKSFFMIGSVDIKKDEKCIHDFSKKHNLECEFIDRESIRKIHEKYQKSEFVMKNIGVYSVSEPVCDILSNNNIISERYKGNGITITIGRKIN